MPRRSARARRSSAEWGVRALLAAAAAAGGCASVAQSLAYALRAGAPEQAHALAPWDGQTTALLARKLSGPEATARDRTRADQLARTALRQDATAVVAASTLGINAQLRNDTRDARRLFAYSQTLSRRDLQTQLWAVEDSVSRGDVAGALRHYDIALRTTREAPTILFPVLASAVAEPAIRSALIKTLAARPSWGDDFVGYLAGAGPNPRATASLILGASRVGIVIPDSAKASVVSGLVAGNFLDDAWSYYATVRPGADRRMSRDPQFAADIAAPSLFDWMPINDGGVSTSIQRGDKGGVFDFSAPSSIGGPLLQQMQLLPPGTYRLEGHSAGIDQPEGSRPYWVLSCRNGRELGRAVMPNSSQTGGGFAGQFSVSAGCPAQTLVLVARPSDEVSGTAGQIDRVRLVPAQ